MDLLLWRHGDTADEGDDMARGLSERGHRQALAVAGWLALHAPAGMRVLVSPARRTRDTAEALSRSYEVDDALAPGACVSEIIGASGWPQGSGAVLVVSHQPVIGRLAALLLAGEEADWTVKKGALWWFSNRVRRGETQTVLRAAVSPELLRAAGPAAAAPDSGAA